MAAATISAVGGMKVGLGSSTSSWAAGEDHGMLVRTVTAPVRLGAGRASRTIQPMMKNVNEGKGVFAPVVVLARNIIGKKRFNQIRGKAIALHSQVITEFCKSIGADAKQRQELIRLAKKNGERLGFLA
ncbi:Protein PROTON GRADIENT REGULATION 5, chloroplastic [Dionaea muscipula]